MLRPEIITPLGSPVVPEVYSWVITSSGSGSNPGSEVSSVVPASLHRGYSSKDTQVRTEVTRGAISLTAPA
jgi:hypothetical protein